MKKPDKQLILSIKNILSSNDDMKITRIKKLIASGYFHLSDKDIDSLLNPKIPTRKNSNGTKEKDNGTT
jgi:hypothetical protein